ncbi:MAG: thioesterase family protein [Cyclobacteriaceae bacterium]
MTQAPADRLVFTRTLVVAPGDIDELRHVNNVVYLQWVQDIAAAHWNHIASEAIRQQFVWVARRHEIDYLLPSFEGDTLTLQTWVESWGGVSCIRCVQIMRDTKLVVEAKTVWCMLDASTMRLRRIEDPIAATWLKATP